MEALCIQWLPHTIKQIGAFLAPLLLCPNYVLNTIIDEILQLEAIEYVPAVVCF